MKASILTIAASLLPVAMLIAQEPVTTPVQPVDPPALVDEKFDPLHPYAGESRKGVDTKTLEGKIMAGYQGWFNTPEVARGWAGRIGRAADRNPSARAMSPSIRLSTSFSSIPDRPAGGFPPLG